MRVKHPLPPVNRINLRSPAGEEGRFFVNQAPWPGIITPYG